MQNRGSCLFSDTGRSVVLPWSRRTAHVFSDRGARILRKRVLRSWAGRVGGGGGGGLAHHDAVKKIEHFVRKGNSVSPY